MAETKLNSNQIGKDTKIYNVNENGDLYITDEQALNNNEEKYPLIYRTKSEDDNNTIKINAPVEIIENPDSGPRSLKVSGSLSAKDTKVHSLTIDGTVRSHGNIWMGRISLGSVLLYMRCQNGEVFHSIGQEGSVYSWYSDQGNTVYTENEYPYVYEEQAFSDIELTEPYQWIEEVWEEKGEWDSSKASIKEVKSISFHNDDDFSNGYIDNVYKIRGQNWKIEGNGTVELKDVKGDGWKIVGGNIEGKKNHTIF